ncbi:GNAT family N-acetyltransferase [Tumebacillus sp. ITR2]|uniref:GNAT family N-acetyltransferase n=1 Tax=Tumebacillus amylolyticus TaxID=2801339 RepID=A0ABS1JAX0_9BACL|nr:GNAT family N-acetyltransferase [Tumebacillus amylolyticus]MBL0387430.1 GNAT family N-acetyltransferase [Tumebacillus amylolyticus]
MPEMRAATTNDLDALLEIYRAVIRRMQAGGNDQWDDTYPNRTVLEADLAAGTLFVCVDEDEKLLGAVVLNESIDEPYSQIQWDDAQGKWLVVHRLAVHPDTQGRGIGRDLMGFAEQWGLENGYSSIRLDTYSRNKAAVALYLRLGYVWKGEIHFQDRRAEPYVCFEKELGKADVAR